MADSVRVTQAAVEVVMVPTSQQVRVTQVAVEVVVNLTEPPVLAPTAFAYQGIG